MRKIFAILLLSVLLSCNNKNGSIADRFKTIQPLTHKVFEVQNGENELMDPYNLAVVGNTVTLLNSRAPKIFTTIDISTGRVIKQWGDKGQGPNEFLGRIDMKSNYSETGLNIWDSGSSKLYFFLNSDLESGLINFQNISVNINDDRLNRYDSVIQLDTFVFFASGGNNDKQFTLFDTKRNMVKEIGDYPPEDKTDIDKSFPPIFRKQAYNGRLRYNSSIKKLVYISIASEMFEIYNFDGADVEFAMGNYSTIPKYKEDSSGGVIRVMTELATNGKGINDGITVSDKNIFILYKDYKRLGIEQEVDTDKPADIVLVFDWNGKPVKKYELDCPVMKIDYDKARNRLWAVHYNEDTLDPEIIYFEL